jgi:transposase
LAGGCGFLRPFFLFFPVQFTPIESNPVQFLKPFSAGLASKVRTGGVALEEAVMKEIKRRRHHSREYRNKAVELLLAGKTLEDLAGDLGVAKSTLIRWKEDYLVDLAQHPKELEGLSALELVQKYQQLRQEHEKLKRQQEILKKALGIFSEARPSDMP